jgi:hypothetical protein
MTINKHTNSHTIHFTADYSIYSTLNEVDAVLTLADFFLGYSYAPFSISISVA